MATFNFTKAERTRLGSGSNLPEDTLRLSRKTLSFNESVSKSFTSTRYKTPSGETRAKVSIAYDLYNQAIQLKSDPEGFTIAINESGSSNAYMPASLRKAGLPVGDYKMVDPSTVNGERNVFQLAR